MQVYVVEKEDTLSSISQKFDIQSDTIIAANHLKNPFGLATGQTLVIPDKGSRLINVKSSDNLTTISKSQKIPIDEIKSANPSINPLNELFAGQLLVLPKKGTRKSNIEVNGYVFKNTSLETIISVLPSLTFLSVFSYRLNSDGNLIRINDKSIVELAIKNKVSPIMVVSESESNNIVEDKNINLVLENETSRKNLVNNIYSVVKEKGYYGVNLCFKNIHNNQSQQYLSFLSELRERLKPLTSIILNTIVTDNELKLITSENMQNHSDLENRFIDRFIFRTYKNNYLKSPPQALTPYNIALKTIDSSLKNVKSNKILVGITNYGYDWILPFKSGDNPKVISNSEATEIAYKQKVTIKFDNLSKSPYFNYYDTQRRQHIVWFEDARSIEAKLSLIDRYHLSGVSFLFLDRGFEQNIVLLNSIFNIKKFIK